MYIVIYLKGRPVETVSQLDVFIHYVREEEKRKIWTTLEGGRRELTWWERAKYWGWEIGEKILWLIP